MSLSLKNTPFRSSRHHLVSGAKSYVCSVNPTNLALWFEVPLVIWYPMFMCFLSLELWLIIKTKVIVSRNQVVKRYFTSNFTVKLLQQNIRVWPLWRLKQNISWQIGFQATIFVFINQPEVENNINTTPWATFYPKPETNFTGFNMVQSLQFCPTYKKMALWSPKRCILRHD